MTLSIGERGVIALLKMAGKPITRANYIALDYAGDVPDDVELPDYPWEDETLTDFDPDEPRDDRGRWAQGEAVVHGAEFVSPNVSSNLDLPEAIHSLTGDRQMALTEAAAQIHRALGIVAHSVPAVGAWADGAENSVMTRTEGATMAQLRVAAAMQGYLADQKAVLIFDENPKGKSWLYSFQAKGALADIHKNAIDDGLAFHTLEPNDRGALVHVAAIGDNDVSAAVKRGADRYGSEVEAKQGDAEFVGGQSESGSDREQRDEAKSAYSRAIEGSGVQGADTLWQRVHYAYGEDLIGSHPKLKMAA
jgi:hypothetical protein